MNATAYYCLFHFGFAIVFFANWLLLFGKHYSPGSIDAIVLSWHGVQSKCKFWIPFTPHGENDVTSIAGSLPLAQWHIHHLQFTQRNGQYIFAGIKKTPFEYGGMVGVRVCVARMHSARANCLLYFIENHFESISGVKLVKDGLYQRSHTRTTWINENSTSRFNSKCVWCGKFVGGCRLQRKRFR